MYTVNYHTALKKNEVTLVELKHNYLGDTLRKNPIEQHASICAKYKGLFKDMGDSLVAQLVKNPPAMQETPVQFLGQEDLLKKG